MGTVAVAVGCPHRLRQPIGPRTAQPCQVCASYGPPGWPRLAWAMTVDYGPRLSRAATSGVVRTPPPPPPRPSKVPDTIARMQRALAEVKPPDLSGLHAAAARMEADVQRLASKVVVEMGALRVNIEQTAQDRAANVVRVMAEQPIRFRSRP